MDMWWRYDRTGIEFVLFSVDHWIALSMGSLIIILLFTLRKHLQHDQVTRGLLYGTATLLIVCEIILQIWYVWHGHWALRFSLPLQLCSITLLVSAVMLVTRSYRLFEFIYFAGIGGALMALFTPELVYAFPHTVYLLFFISHFGIIIAAIWMIILLGYRPVLRSIGRTMLWLNILLVPIYFINVLTGGNYMFLMRKPGTASPLDYFGPWPWYIVGMELMALFTFCILYIPFIRFKKKNSHCSR